MTNEEFISYILDHTNGKGAIIVAYARSIRDETIPVDGWGYINSAIAARWSHSIMLTIKRKAWALIDRGSPLRLTPHGQPGAAQAGHDATDRTKPGGHMDNDMLLAQFVMELGRCAKFLARLTEHVDNHLDEEPDEVYEDAVRKAIQLRRALAAISEQVGLEAA